jgi:FkbM family methyltransferase
MKRTLRRLRRLFRPAPPPPTVSADTVRLIGLMQAHGITHVLDVGANLGQYASLLRQAGYAGKITSFEPIAETHRALSAAASGDPRWAVAPRMALGARDGQVAMHVSNRSDMSSVMAIETATLEAIPRAFETSIEDVPIDRLDAVFDRFVDPGDTVLLKLDTQGSEYAILDGADGVMHRIAGLQIELSLFALYKGEATYLDVMGRVRDHGFEAYLFLPGYFSRKLNRQLQMDGIFFRPPAAPAAR